MLGPPPQLFDLGADLGETHNLAEQRLELVERLTKFARGVRAETGLSAVAP